MGRQGWALEGFRQSQVPANSEADEKQVVAGHFGAGLLLRLVERSLEIAVATQNRRGELVLADLAFLLGVAQQRFEESGAAPGRFGGLAQEGLLEVVEAQGFQKKTAMCLSVVY